MRWNIKGFDQYEVDETGQVWAKSQKRRFGNSCRLPRKATKARKGGHVANAEGGAPATPATRRN